jgi:hypothetical protein
MTEAANIERQKRWQSEFVTPHHAPTRRQNHTVGHREPSTVS